MKKKTLFAWLIAVAMVVSMIPLYAVAQAASQLAGEEYIDIPDPAFKSILNHYIGTVSGDTTRPEDSPITKEEMKLVRSIYFQETQSITDITGIQYATNLTHLNISGSVDGVDELAQLENLQKISISYHDSLTDLTFLGNKPNLSSLSIGSCKNFTSLSGLTRESFPALASLTFPSNPSLRDLSALSNVEFPTLTSLDLDYSNNVTDITPLKGYTSLTNLQLTTVGITADNRAGYRDTIASLTGLTHLSMGICQITDEDAQAMFPPLSRLTHLFLEINDLTNLDFMDDMSADLTSLGLALNNISDLSKVANFPNLTKLMFGYNSVSDFRFISQLPQLTADTDVYLEGTEKSPLVSRVSIGQPSAPVNLVDGTLTIPNPYVQPNGEPVSFAETVSSSSTCTISYNETTNEITLKNLNGSVNFYTTYTMTLPTGESKFCHLYIDVYARNHQHTWAETTYTWAEDGSSCTASRVCETDATHVETATAVISQAQTKAPTCTQMGETTYTATFTQDWAVSQTKTLADVAMLPHSYGEAWKWDDTSHFHVCELCGKQTDVATHSFQWITDTQAGEKYQKCTVCGYQLAAEPLPTSTPAPSATPNPVPSATPDPSQPPQTGDTSSVLLWISALAMCSILLPALMAWKRNAK